MNTEVMNVILILVGLVGSFATVAFIQRLFTPEEEVINPITSAQDLEQRELSVFNKLNPHGPFIDKVDIFLARTCKLDKKLEEAYVLLGRPEDTDPLKMLRKKEIVALVVGGLIFFLTNSFLFSLISLLVGFLLPDVIDQRKIRERQAGIIRTFPTFVDLTALMIESGQDYMTAFDKIIRISPNKTPLELEVGKVINEVQLGYSRRDALRRFSERTGIQEIRSFVGLIIQSDELGTSLVDLLRNFSGDMRFRRMNKAEQLAAAASTKMLIPLFIFIFPVVFILMLAPMVYDLFTGGMPF
ncbi:MAG: type II secretion system F family protein [Elusimicrobiales bacterium]|nr:type II secretion system F family protein [Elusimicrobiales bacterium]